MSDDEFVRRFKQLEEEMQLHYFWCKVKMNIYGIVLLLLFLFLR